MKKYSNIHILYILYLTKFKESTNSCYKFLFHYLRYILLSIYLNFLNIHSFHFSYSFIFTFYWPVSLLYWTTRLREVSGNRLLLWRGAIQLLRLLCWRTIKLLGLLWRGTVKLLRLLWRRTIKLLRGVAVRLLWRKTKNLRWRTVLSGHSAVRSRCWGGAPCWPRGRGWAAPGVSPAVAGVTLGPVVTGGDQRLGQQHREVGNGSHRGKLAVSSPECWHWCRLMTI